MNFFTSQDFWKDQLVDINRYNKTCSMVYLKVAKKNKLTVMALGMSSSVKVLFFLLERFTYSLW